MNKVLATQSDMNKRKLICGVGVNDSLYKTHLTDNSINPAYDRWDSMLTRCYSLKYQKKHPAYIGCTVVKEWFAFSNFEVWFDEHYIDGCHLDKDLKIIGNKIYGPDTCLFIPQAINSLLTNNKCTNDKLPKGVTSHKSTGKYISRCNVDGDRKYLGLFKTSEQAGDAYVVARNEEIMRKCGQHPELKEYLLAHLES